MNCAIIDVGSNSVRLLIKKENKSYKKMQNTRLAEGFKDGCLSFGSITRTVDAVCMFVAEARQNFIEKIYAFGTAILRKAGNAGVFIESVQKRCGIEVEIISGDLEAELGVLGAVPCENGGVIDIGGASTEIVALKNNKIIYSKSADMGAVVVKDACGQDMSAGRKFIADKMDILGNIEDMNYYAIGGTVTSLASVLLGLEEYNPQKTDNYNLSMQNVRKLTECFYGMSIEERFTIRGLQKERAEIISCGTLILLMIMETYNLKKVIVRESDNLEGYYIKRLKNE